MPADQSEAACRRQVDHEPMEASNRPTKATLGNGLSIEQGFSPYTGQLYESTVETTLARRLHETYQYDVLGNVSQRIQEWGSTKFVEDFTYDQLN